MASWIKIFRELLQWEWFQKAEMVQLFIYLLLKASCTDKQWQGMTVKRGQLVTSNATMRQDLRLSEQQIRTCIKRLISTGEITYKSTNRYVVITICNYDKYQEIGNPINEQNNVQTNNQSTNEQRAINEQSTTSKEVKNIRSKEYNIKDIKQESGSNDQLSSASDEAKAVEPAKPKTEKLPFKEIKEMWNETCPGFPKLFTISEARKNKMRLRIAEMGGLEKALPLIKQIFEKMQQSKFLKGDNKRGWKASFDWLFENDKNWVKVYEGNYDNKPEQAAAKRYNANNRNCNDEWK
jgi:hypothetical protein|nr:MAG TPA: replisome organizer [Caudoviricetes sp.]